MTLVGTVGGVMGGIAWTTPITISAYKVGGAPAGIATAITGAVAGGSAGFYTGLTSSSIYGALGGIAALGGIIASGGTLLAIPAIFGAIGGATTGVATGCEIDSSIKLASEDSLIDLIDYLL